MIGLGLSVFGVAAVGAFWWFGYAGPKAKLEKGSALWQESVQRFDADSAGMAEVTKRLKAFADSTLGSTEESVSADVRTALNEMAAAVGLKQTTVATLSPSNSKNPAAAAATEFKESGLRSMREAVDFRAMPANMTGKGSFEQCVAMIGTVSAQDWAHRVNSIMLRPQNKERTQFEVAIGLTTLFAADLPPSKVRTKLWQPAQAAEVAAWGPIVAKNIFRDPPDAAAPTAVVVAAAAAPAAVAVAGPTLAEWRVAAVVRGKDGAELWLTNIKTGEKRKLKVGESVLEARFLGGAAGVARLGVGDGVFEVSLNERVDQRRAVPLQSR